MLRLLRTLLALTLLTWSVALGAVTVAVVGPTERSPELAEALGRLRGELGSVGFSTQFVALPQALTEGPPSNVKPWLEELAKRRDLDAVVAILGDRWPDSVEVWVVDEITGKSVVRTVRIGPDDTGTPEVLSVRAIELLRSSLLELELGARSDSHEPPPATVVRYLESERQRLRPRRFAAELGGVVTTSLDEADPALLPALRLDWAPSASWFVYLEAAGLGARSQVETNEGSAELTHAHGLIGTSYIVTTTGPLRPFFSLSAGVLHVAVVGRPRVPSNQGHSLAGSSFLIDGGLGVAVSLHDPVFLSLGTRAQLAQPAPAVRFLGDAVTTWGRPNVAAHLTLGAWL